MRILIEEYQYKYEDVCDVLKGLGVLQDVEGKVSLSYVGYYFNDDLDVNDCVFILPKVLLEGEFGKEKVFGHIEPRDLINAEDCKDLTTEEHTFIYNLSVWIYRASPCSATTSLTGWKTANASRASCYTSKPR